VLNARGLLGEAVEVGVQSGLFSEVILNEWKGRRLHLVDPWLSAPAEEYIDRSNVSQERHDHIYAEALDRVARFGERALVHRTTSVEAAATFADKSVDFVYLDARHDERSVLEDLDAWYPKLRSGGILAGHDYLDGAFAAGEFGVRRAVERFSEVHELCAWATYRDTPWVSFICVVGTKPTLLERLAATALRRVVTSVKRMRGAPRPI
jgi:hypothetical protein